jgi:Icc-related predicted phosphoesterase
MELLYTSDLHGSSNLYSQLLEQFTERPSDGLVLGGAILPDGDRGMPYASVCRFIREDFREFLERVREVRSDTEVLTIFGNHDWSFSVEEFQALQDQSLLTMLRHDGLHTVGGFDFLGLSYCPPAPYWIKDFERRDLENDAPSEFGGYVWSYEDKRIKSVTGRRHFSHHESLEKMLSEVPASDRFIFVAHAPPRDGNLDILLDGRHVGSNAVRRFIERTGPILTLHGHLHESPIVSGHYTEKINDSLCVNAGQDEIRVCSFRWNSEQPDEPEHSLDWNP